SDKLWEDPPGCEEMRDGEEWLDVEAIKITLLKMCIESGVDLLFDTLVVGVMNDDSRGAPNVSGVIIENKSGRQAIKGKIIIDASAYLDVVWFATGHDGVIINKVADRIDPGWYTVFGGVDSKKFMDWVIETKPCTGYPSLKNPDKVRYHLSTGRLLLYNGFANILDEAYDKGLLEDWPDESSLPIRLNIKWWGKDRWCTSIDAMRELDGLDGWDLSRGELKRQLIDWQVYQIMKLVPGWEESYLSRTSSRIGLRETRILKAVYMLTKDDIFNPDHDREDAIGRSGAHDPGKNKLRKAYPIPYGIMIPEKLNGVICCSRAIGAADRVALNAHRGITPTIVVGQAAGTAAALSIKSGVEPRNVDLKALRKILRDNDVVLDVETLELDTIPDRYKN
ncbi:MAG: FAD-dependent oxidoreductase, partial [Promethearchaeota archaeon]